MGQTDGGYDWGLTDKCGECYEVLCVHGPTRGPEGKLGPSEGCISPGKTSIVVKVTDSCPCHHLNTNNKRWCCGDAVHVDLSWQAFQKIALLEKGAVDVKVRTVDCSIQGQTFEHSMR